MGEPAFVQAIQKLVTQGAQTVDVLPLFLNAGNHVSKDVPGMVTAARKNTWEFSFACSYTSAHILAILAWLKKWLAIRIDTTVLCCGDAS
jgi:sirohydrochlorin ferrochelatase